MIGEECFHWAKELWNSINIVEGTLKELEKITMETFLRQTPLWLLEANTYNDPLVPLLEVAQAKIRIDKETIWVEVEHDPIDKLLWYFIDVDLYDVKEAHKWVDKATAYMIYQMRSFHHSDMAQVMDERDFPGAWFKLSRPWII